MEAQWTKQEMRRTLQLLAEQITKLTDSQSQMSAPFLQSDDLK